MSRFGNDDQSLGGSTASGSDVSFFAQPLTRFRQTPEPLLSIYRPSDAHYVPTVSRFSGLLDNYQHVFRHVAGLPRLNRFERWAAEINNPYGQFVARYAVKTINFVSDHPIESFLSFWALLLLTNTFHIWGVEQNIQEGGTGEGPNVFVQSTKDALSILAIGIITFQVLAFALRSLRGARRPDYKPFLNFTSYIKGNNEKPLDSGRKSIKGLSLEANADIEKRRIITDPDPDSPEECDECVSWYTGFISWLSDGADSPSNLEEDLEGVWEAIGYILRNLREEFPFEFRDRYEETVPDTAPPSPSLTSQPAASRDEGPSDSAASSLRERMRDVSRRSGFVNRVHQIGGGVRFESTAWTMLPRPLVQSPAREDVLDDIPSATPLIPSPIQERPRRLIERDLYKTPLLDHNALNKKDDSTSISVPPLVMPFEVDSFLTASPEEKRAAAKLDWREMQTWPYKKETNYPDIAMRVLSHVVNLRIKRTGLMEKEDKREKAADILYGLLNGLLTDPFITDRPQGGRNFTTESAYKSFQLVNLLRPAMADGQWHNWRYFYAQDPVVTDAFKRLTPQKQAWMIFTLMEGNDHGKLLALSILQDPRLALTRFNAAEDRSYKTAVQDVVEDSCLSTFFLTYLREFGSMSKARLRTACKDFYHTDMPSEIQFKKFKAAISHEMRLQLLWLTENSTGRLEALFKEHAAVASKILLRFTVGLPAVDDVENSYAVPAAKPSEAPSIKVRAPASAQGNSRPSQYSIKPTRHDGRFGFSLLGPKVTRADVVNALKPSAGYTVKIVNYYPENPDEPEEKQTLSDYLSNEIVALLRRSERRHTVSTKLAEGVKLAEQIEAIENRMKLVRQECLRHAPDVTVADVSELLLIESLQELNKYYSKSDAKLIHLSRNQDPERYRKELISSLMWCFKTGIPRSDQLRTQLSDYCKKPETVATYLEYGVGFNQPLGARTAAVYLALKDNCNVEVYEEDMTSHDRSLRLEARIPKWGLDVLADGSALSVVPIVIGEYFSDWTVLSKDVVNAPASVPTSNVVNQRSLGSEMPHPMVMHAQYLYWSVRDPEQQEAIRERMEYGHPSDVSAKTKKPSVQLESSHPLFNVDYEEYVDAIKRGVLQSCSFKNGILQTSSLKALLYQFRRRDPSSRDRACNVLAALLSDSVYGVDFQVIFATLVEKHYDELANKEQKQYFLDWLAHRAPNAVDKVVVKNRYITTIVLETSKLFDDSADIRTESILDILREYYKGDDLITVFHRMREVGKAGIQINTTTNTGSTVAWVARRDAFALVFLNRIIDAEARGALDSGSGLEFMSADDRMDLFDLIIQSFDNDLLSEARGEIGSMGDLLGVIFTEGYAEHAEYMDRLVKRFCEQLRHKNASPNQRINLTITLLSALQATETKAARIQMYEVLCAYINGLGAEPTTHNIDFDRINSLLGVIAVATHEEFIGNKSRVLYARGESFCIRIAVYLLERSQDPKNQTTATDRLIAYNLLRNVVANVENYKHILRMDRALIASQLVGVIFPDTYNGVKTAPDVIAHQDMVHKTLYALFSDIDRLNIAQYGPAFLTVCDHACSRVEADVADGLSQLVAGIVGNTDLQGIPTESRNTVLNRMLALALYQQYQEIPQSFKWTLSDRQQQQLQRLNIAGRMKRMLESVHHSNADFSINDEVRAWFLNQHSELAKAFAEMGMESTAKSVCDAIIAYNKQSVSYESCDLYDSSNPDERDGLLKSSAQNSVAMSETSVGSSFV